MDTVVVIPWVKERPGERVSVSDTPACACTAVFVSAAVIVIGSVT